MRNGTEAHTIIIFLDRPAQDAAVQVATPTMTAVAQAVSWSGIGRIVSQLTWFISLLVLAALLPPRDFGTIAVGMAVLMVATLIMESGTAGGIIASESVTGDQLRASVVRNFAVGVSATVVLILLASPLVNFFARGADPAVVRVMLLSITATALGIVPLALLNKALQFKRRAQATIGAGVISSVAAVATALGGGGVWSLVVRLVLNQVLLAGFAWIAVRDLWPRRSPTGSGLDFGRTGASWFLLMAVANFATFSLLNLVIGRIAGIAELGLYSLAFTLAFAPLTYVSWQIGGVLFPVFAATGDRERVRRRTLKSMRLIALVLFPFTPPVLVLAPVVVPAVLGERWSGMVVPFQIMLVAGVGHAVINIFGETLAGSGNAAFRARVEVVWALATVGAVILLTSSHGIRGAASAHLVTLLLLALAYLTRGVRLVGLTAARVWRELRTVVVCLAVQSAVTAAIALRVKPTSAEEAVAAIAGAFAGAVVAAVLLVCLARDELRELREVVGSVFERRSQECRVATDGGLGT